MGCWEAGGAGELPFWGAHLWGPSCPKIHAEEGMRTQARAPHVDAVAVAGHA